MLIYFSIGPFSLVLRYAVNVHILLCSVNDVPLIVQKLFQDSILPKNIANQTGFLLDWKANNWYR